MFPFMEKEPRKKKECRACFKVKPVESFPKSYSHLDPYKNRCKLCVNNGIFIEKKKKKKLKDSADGNLRLFIPTLNDYAESYRWLSIMGYDVSGDVNEQFCRKYGLEPEPRRWKKWENTYTKEQIIERMLK